MGRLQSLFPPHQFDVIIGSLLGDARLECRSIGKRHAITARLRIHQSEKQKDYVFWKYKTFQNLVSEGPKRINVWHDAKRNKDHYSWYFHTKTSEEFGLLHPYFYDGRVKIISDAILNVLTPRAMAVWFMDDGSNVGKSFTLSTHCFLEDEQLRILKFLQNRYGIVGTLVKDRTKFKIGVGRHEYQKFKEIIKPYIIPLMIYKIDNPRNDLSEI